ncbi:MAG: tetratricopeptide repeat protein, partial [Lentisphaerae bacterium]|nr:tetratricopeptide repeat protein [Lentisphaerota bacterium]
LWAVRDPSRAVNLLRDALARNPDDLTLLDLLARILMAQNRGPEALATFERLLEIVGDTESDQLTAVFFAGYAEAARISGQLERAGQLYDQALLKDPLLLDAYVGLALLHLECGHNAAAMEAMRRALEVLPDHPGAHYLAGLLANRAGDHELARTAFARVQELEEQDDRANPPDLTAEFYFNYGAACERGGFYKQAEELLLRAIAMDDRHAEAFNYLAYMWAEQERNLEQALFYIEHALELDPENGAFLDTLGWVYFRMGRMEEAREKIAEALLRLKDDPVVLEHYGDIHHALGHTDQAVKFWLRSWQAGARTAELEEKLRSAGVLPEISEEGPVGVENAQQEE